MNEKLCNIPISWTDRNVTKVRPTELKLPRKAKPYFTASEPQN